MALSAKILKQVVSPPPFRKEQAPNSKSLGPERENPVTRGNPIVGFGWNFHRYESALFWGSGLGLAGLHQLFQFFVSQVTASPAASQSGNNLIGNAFTALGPVLH